MSSFEKTLHFFEAAVAARMGSGKVEVFSIALLALSAIYMALLPGYYEITQMAPVISAPREKVFRYLSEPRNFATLASPELLCASLLRF